eukprot:2008616-Prymnesium_polylepis.1
MRPLLLSLTCGRSASLHYAGFGFLGSGATASPPPGRQWREERVTSGACRGSLPLGERPIFLGTGTQASIHSSLE